MFPLFIPTTSEAEYDQICRSKKGIPGGVWFRYVSPLHRRNASRGLSAIAKFLNCFPINFTELFLRFGVSVFMWTTDFGRSRSSVYRVPVCHPIPVKMVISRYCRRRRSRVEHAPNVLWSVWTVRESCLNYTQNGRACHLHSLQGNTCKLVFASVPTTTAFVHATCSGDSMKARRRLDYPKASPQCCNFAA